MAIIKDLAVVDYKPQTFNKLAKSAYGSSWQGTDARVAELSKALATSDIAGFANGSALVLQNLESMFTSVLYDETQLVKQRWIEHVPSINPVFQWNRRNQYGTSRGAIAFAEGGMGPNGNAAWTRNTADVTFFGVQRGTTVIANIAGALGGMFDNPIDEEEYDGTMQLLGGVEHALTWGNSTITDLNGNVIFYDGLYRQLKFNCPQNIIDMHGKPMNFDVVSQIAALYAKVFVNTARDVGGFLTPDTLATLQLMKTQAERRDMGNINDGGYTAGTPISDYATPIGRIPFVQDVFLDPFDGGKAPLTTADNGSPASPTGVTSAVAAPTTGQNSNWQSSDQATVYYTVSAFSAQGESLGTIMGAGTSALTGDIVTLTIPNVTGAYGYRVYRGLQSNGSDAGWIGDTPRTATANATFVDDNSIMPNTDVACFMNKNPQNLVIAQMAPLLKLPFAVQNTTIPFGLLYLHTLAIKAVERQFMVINIGKTGYSS